MHVQYVPPYYLVEERLVCVFNFNDDSISPVLFQVEANHPVKG
jgi:hypothetical protein